MFYRIVMAIVGLSMFVSPAQASFWIECAVVADVSQGDDGLNYQLSIIEAVVIQGHATEGDECFSENDMVLVPVTDADFSVGKGVKLKYNLYNGRGPDGVVNSESWRRR